MRRVLAAASIVTFVIVGFAQPAGALKPFRQSLEESFGYVDRTCGFRVHVHEDATARLTTFFNSDGDLVRERLHATFHGTWMNNKSGAWLAEDETTNFVFIRATRETRVVGLNWHFKLPSGRTVAIDAGRLIVDRHGNIVFEAGNHEIVDSQFEVLCPYLD